MLKQPTVNPLLLPQISKRVTVLISFYLISFLLFFGFCAITGNSAILNKLHLLNWDAIHYYKIAQKGYAQHYLTAFFPLFPLTWKVTGLGALGISLLNAFIYILAASALGVCYKFTIREQLLAASIPSLIFMFLPYSEALFYTGGVTLLYGLSSNKKRLVCIGLVVCSLSRPAIYILLPAVIVCEFLFSINVKAAVKSSALYTIAILSGLLITFTIQHYYTGQWFAFFESQRKWDNSLRIPALPLTSWGGDVIVRLDGTALLIGIIATGILIKTLMAYIKNKTLQISKPLLFCCLYLSGISLLVLMLRGGSLFSLNRFVFASPFFTVALICFKRNTVFTLKQAGYLLGALTIYWLLFASYVHIQAFLFFFMVSIYLAYYNLLNLTHKALPIALMLLITSNVVLFFYFYYRFLSNLWVA